MNTEETLDFSIAGMDATEDAAPAPITDPWLSRRGCGFGASDVPVLLAAMSIAPLDLLPKYAQARAKVTNRTHGVARIFAEKAGLVAPLASGPAAAQGTRHEERLLLTWQTLLTRRQWYGQHERLLVPGTLALASAAPREWYPLVDRHCPALTCTPDAWMRDALDGLVKVEAKCTTRETREARWSWRVQVQAQLAVSGADSGVIVCGDGWAASWRSENAEGPSGPIRSWPVLRDDAEIARIRAAVSEGWAIVERLKAAKVEKAA